ncbi:MAG TPA: hypothetical protein DCS79_00675 [Gammaproteobacteria bacterium]|nr:hypothetical protein [Gammaproteobacteria bacterium]
MTASAGVATPRFNTIASPRFSGALTLLFAASISLPFRKSPFILTVESSTVCYGALLIISQLGKLAPAFKCPLSLIQYYFLALQPLRSLNVANIIGIEIMPAIVLLDKRPTESPVIRRIFST